MSKEIAQRVAGLIEPVIKGMAFELVDVEYLSQRGRWVLRITADKPGGITLDDCARISREIGDLIDVSDAIMHKYDLEVSSPGLNRPLKRERDFLRVIGEKVKVRMARPIDGRRNFSGVLQKIGDDTLYVRMERDVFPLPLKDVEKANLVYGFGGEKPGPGKRRSGRNAP